MNTHGPSGGLLDLPLRDFLEQLASSAPAPGGGAAAALVGALAASLVEMTANLTVGRPRYAAVDEQAQRIRSAAGTLRTRLQDAVQADAVAYGAVSASYRRPKTSPEEQAARTAAIQAALYEAAQVPLVVARDCAAVLALCEEAAPILNRTVISDVVTAAQLAVAGVEAAATNVEVNLDAMTDQGVRAEIARQLAEPRGAAQTRLARTMDAARAR